MSNGQRNKLSIETLGQVIAALEQRIALLEAEIERLREQQG